MSHTYTSLLTHIVYSTKERAALIDSELESRLFPYFGGILRELGGKLLKVDGTEDHVHLLADIPASISVAEAVGKIKGSSSRWIHETFGNRSGFSWQRGYAAFSVSKSGLPSVVAYIESQKTHHAKWSFRDELLKLLRCHGVSVDEKYLGT